MRVLQKETTLAFLPAILALAGPALAEEPAATPPPPTPIQLQQQLQQQQARILELERLLNEQGAVLELLRQQLTPRAATPAPEPDPASTAAPTLESSTQPPEEQELDRISGELEALAEHNKELGDKVNSLEKKANDSEKNLASKIKGLGHFTFSGDFRLRYEPFFGGTLPQDRHRERVRLRFNAIAKFSGELTGGLTIASGDETDPISTNQTLTNFFERKPIGIDRAFLQYQPQWWKPLTLTGGKFTYTWSRTELTWDNDLNPEGFSEALAFDIKNPVLKKVTLVGLQLPFRESGVFDDSFMYGGQVGSVWTLGDRVQVSGYAAFYNWHRADFIRPAQVANNLTGSTNTNAANATAFASRFALLDLIGRVDIHTGKPRWPLMLQLDFVNNTRPCVNAAEAGVACNPRDRSGWWAEVQLGKTVEKNDLNFGYTFIRIEREAVLAAFNFSDLRQPTNVVNHRFNVGYQAYKNVTVGYTLLVGRALSTATTVLPEDWPYRMQFDVVYKF